MAEVDKGLSNPMFTALSTIMSPHFAAGFVGWWPCGLHICWILERYVWVHWNLIAEIYICPYLPSDGIRLKRNGLILFDWIVAILVGGWPCVRYIIMLTKDMFRCTGT